MRSARCGGTGPRQTSIEISPIFQLCFVRRPRITTPIWQSVPPPIIAARAPLMWIGVSALASFGRLGFVRAAWVRSGGLGSFGRLGFVRATWLRSGDLASFGRLGFVRAAWLRSFGRLGFVRAVLASFGQLGFVRPRLRRRAGGVTAAHSTRPRLNRHFSSDRRGTQEHLVNIDAGSRRHPLSSLQLISRLARYILWRKRHKGRERAPGGAILLRAGRRHDPAGGCPHLS